MDVLVVEDLHQQRLAARHIVAALRQAGLTARLVHFGEATAAQEVIALVGRLRPRLVIFSILFAQRLAETLTLIAHLRHAGVTAHLTIAGPLPTFIYQDLLTDCPALDSVLRGEPEANVVQLAANLVRGADPTAVPGLAYRAPDTCSVSNPLPAGVSDLDALPLPARDEGIPTFQGFGFVTLESSQGCYHACSICLARALYRVTAATPYRQRSIASLVDEIEPLYRQGARLFLFDDQQFLAPKRVRARRVEDFGCELARRGLQIAFTIKCRPDDVDATLFSRLKEIGLLRVYLGLESGCQADLDLFNKRTTVSQNVRALTVLDALDIVADFYYLLFHPWCTLATIEAGLKFLELALPHISTAIAFHEVECLPGTPLHGRLIAERDHSPLAHVRVPPAGWAATKTGSYRNATLPVPLTARPWDYTIADPRAELLRRLARTVFSTRHPGRGVPAQIVRAWYDLLLARRFRPDQDSAPDIQSLREAVTELNAGSLAIWQEMLAFAQAGDMGDAETVNRQAAGWASRVNRLDMHISSLR